jgi:hypothetical protein
MRTANRNALICLALAGGAFLLRHHPQKTVMIKEVQQSRGAVDNLMTTPPAGPEAEVGVKVKDEMRSPAAALPAGPAPHAAELAEYTLLHRKVFLSDGEEAQKATLLKNPSVLRAMGDRLLRAPGDTKGLAEQNMAVEMLLEALRSGDTGVATEVLKGVVSDKQVEDTHLDMATRESLAGVKAEVLYQWSAQIPTQAGELAGLLPGPVSQKIWQNVINMQASNVAESADTK